MKRCTAAVVGAAGEQLFSTAHANAINALQLLMKALTQLQRAAQHEEITAALEVRLPRPDISFAGLHTRLLRKVASSTAVSAATPWAHAGCTRRITRFLALAIKHSSKQQMHAQLMTVCTIVVFAVREQQWRQHKQHSRPGTAPAVDGRRTRSTFGTEVAGNVWAKCTGQRRRHSEA